jgi:hypothetical protein
LNARTRLREALFAGSRGSRDAVVKTRRSRIVRLCARRILILQKIIDKTRARRIAFASVDVTRRFDGDDVRGIAS